MAGLEGRKITVLRVEAVHLDPGTGLDEVSQRVRDLVGSGQRVILIHDAGPMAASLHEALGLAYTVRPELNSVLGKATPIDTMVSKGVVNTYLVAHLRKDGVKALGLSGVDLGRTRAAQVEPGERSTACETPNIDHATLGRLLDEGWVVCLAPVCLGADGCPMAVGPDALARSLSEALGSCAVLDPWRPR